MRMIWAALIRCSGGLYNMPVLLQILLGSGILIVCTLSHIATVAALVRRMRERHAFIQAATVRKTFILSSVVVLVLLLSHTVHIYVWAISLWLMGALTGYEEPIYFSLVTYTTVGYGDVTIDPTFRIFAAMASVNGILAFGVTTAFLVGLFSKILSSLREE
ncbi:MAG: ion channel [Roseobacter sp.]